MKLSTLILIASLLTTQFNCGTLSSDNDQNQIGSANILVWINKTFTSKQTSGLRETTWNKLVIMISAADMDTVIDTFPVTMNQPFNSFTLENIPAGTNRCIAAWTIDLTGDTIHGIDTSNVTIEPAKTTQVLFELIPVKGSLYCVLTEIPTSVDSVYFGYYANALSWETKDKRASKLNLTLDKIPYGTTGTLSIVGYNTQKDTVASWKKSNFIFNNTNTTLQASFISIGHVGLSVTIHTPGVTVILGIMDTTDSLEDEQGGLLISEIMYAANDSEYVELYNPNAVAYDDTIILQLDNGTCRNYIVTIPPKEFFVLGRRALPWADTYHPTTSALDLASTSGNWITIRAKDSTVIDIAAFQSGSNAQGWPDFSTSQKQSIALDSLPDNPEYNNYGKNWVSAVSRIDASVTQQLGTPGKPGF